MIQDIVLSYLEKNRGTIVTGGQIARELNVSRNAIWKAIHALQDKGHEIESMSNCGYRMTVASDGLSKSEIERTLSTESFGRQLEILESIHSTNTFLKGLDTAILPEGYTILADEQTAGRGRLGRTFYSPAHEGVYLSVLLRPQIDLDEVSMLTICAAVTVSEAIEAVCGITTEVKWVNDLYVHGKKLCGILSEAFVSAEMKTVDYIIVGIGVNTGQVDPAVSCIATSIYEEVGMRGLRNRLASEILNRLESNYGAFLTENGRHDVLNAYRRRLFIVGHQVEVIQHDKRFFAGVLGIDDKGALLVQDAEGHQIAIRSGEIRLLQ